MRRQDLEFTYPECLVATQPQEPCRVALCMAGQGPQEINKNQLFQQFKPGDVVVINDTQVDKRRVFAGDLEILFVRAVSDLEWEVLFSARDLKIGQSVVLPGDLQMTLLAKGLPQRVQLSTAIGEKYFDQYAEFALPPYIQKARGQRHSRPEDQRWYQTQWAQNAGSSAAPTASLHFKNEDWQTLRERGVHVLPLTLHVGIGTFLPIKTEDLSQHVMHEEWVSIPIATQRAITQARQSGHRVWALGTTVTRALESWGHHLLQPNEDGEMIGPTRLFIQPGHQFKIVTDLMTNFHQPGSTLLALVATFAGLERVRE
ncbi:MAG: S-adenosylmethionine:tRNA ribosyltransferase-isomerase, partial [Bdellovibrionales bacterium]